MLPGCVYQKSWQTSRECPFRRFREEIVWRADFFNAKRQSSPSSAKKKKSNTEKKPKQNTAELPPVVAGQHPISCFLCDSLRAQRLCVKINRKRTPVFLAFVPLIRFHSLSTDFPDAHTCRAYFSRQQIGKMFSSRGFHRLSAGRRIIRVGKQADPNCGMRPRGRGCGIALAVIVGEC